MEKVKGSYFEGRQLGNSAPETQSETTSGTESTSGEPPVGVHVPPLLVEQGREVGGFRDPWKRFDRRFWNFFTKALVTTKPRAEILQDGFGQANKSLVQSFRSSLAEKIVHRHIILKGELSEITNIEGKFRII